MTIVNCYQKFAFNLNQTIYAEDATELIASKYDWNHLKAGVSFERYVFCDGGGGGGVYAMYELHTIGQMTDETFMSDASEEEEGWSESVSGNIFVNTVSKYSSS
jgi:hypothetical protein